MKKILVMSALVALSTAFVACSNENDLVQQKDEPTGYPLTISVVDNDASRGTDLKKSSTFDFSIYSTMRDTWKTGVSFKNINGTCTRNSQFECSFPELNTEYTFYAISDPDNIADVNNDSKPDLPTLESSPVSFGYQIPNTYADQKDLLVAKATGNASENGGAVNVQFSHALAQITAIKIYCNADNMKPAEAPIWMFRYDGIRLGGLKAVGTYAFGRKDSNEKDDPWIVSELDADNAVFEIPLDRTQMTFENTCFVPGSKENAKTMPLTDGGLYLIPQVATSSVVDIAGGWEIVGAYIEVDIQAARDEAGTGPASVVPVYYNPETNWNNSAWTEAGTDQRGYGRARIPLRFSKLEGGKGYTLIVDVSKAIIIDDDTDMEVDNPLLGTGITIEIS